MQRYLLLFAVIGLFASCKRTEYTPKPSGYFMIDTPVAHQYQRFDKDEYPYAFEYPVYSTIKRDTVFYSGKADNKFWLNLDIPSLGAVINLTYLSIKSGDDFMKMVDDSYKLSEFHNKKADFIREETFKNGYGVTGVLYTVGGNVASRIQFTATDSTHNFIHGSLYFDVTPNADSLKPATDFMEQDIAHFLQTIHFKSPTYQLNR